MNDKQKVHWQPICMAIGVGVGMLIGTIADNIPAGMSTGIGFGLAVGGVIDYVKNKKEKP